MKCNNPSTSNHDQVERGQTKKEERRSRKMVLMVEIVRRTDWIFPPFFCFISHQPLLLLNISRSIYIDTAKVCPKKCVNVSETYYFFHSSDVYVNQHKALVASKVYGLTVFFSEEWLDDGKGAAGEGINTAGKSMTFPLTAKIQGGSNMTGTNCDLFTHKSSRSYLNHLVYYTSGKCH